MKLKSSIGPLVLAIYPSATGFGFALFEGPLRPVDWGVRTARKNKNVRCLKKIAALIDFYHPAAVIIDDYSGEGSRRGRRIQKLIDSVATLAAQKDIPLCGYSRHQVRTFFACYKASTKHDIAVTIATWLPKFEIRLPRVRKPWSAEDYSMCMFDAMALALTHYYFQRQR